MLVHLMVMGNSMPPFLYLLRHNAMLVCRREKEERERRLAEEQEREMLKVFAAFQSFTRSGIHDALP